MNKKIGVICLLIGCLTFVSFVYLHQETTIDKESVYLKTVVFQDDQHDLIPVSINFHSQVERDEEVMNMIELMQSEELIRYGLYPVLQKDIQVLSVKTNEQTLTLDVNQSFPTQPSLNIIEALTYVMSQYDDISELQIKKEGQLIQTSQQYLGLNNFVETSSLLHETIPVMAYHEKNVKQFSYYVPTTLRVDENADMYSLVKTILNHVNSEIQVLDASLDHGVLLVQLANNILLDNETIDKTLQELIVLSLSSIKGVQDVEVQINHEDMRIKKASQIEYNYIKM